MGLGERRKLPQWGPGRSPAPAEIECYAFEVRKSHMGNSFQYFLSDGGAPETSRGPRKLPLSPLSTGLVVYGDFRNHFIKVFSTHLASNICHPL